MPMKLHRTTKPNPAKPNKNVDEGYQGYQTESRNLLPHCCSWGGVMYQLIYDCAHQRSLTDWAKTENRYVILRQETEYSCMLWRISCGMPKKQRQQKGNKDDSTYIKEQRSMCDEWDGGIHNNDHFGVKWNTNQHIWKQIFVAGGGAECLSPSSEFSELTLRYFPRACHV